MAPHPEQVRLFVAGTVIFFGFVVAGYILVKRKSRRKDSGKDDTEENEPSDTIVNHLEKTSQTVEEESIRPARSAAVSAIRRNFENESSSDATKSGTANKSISRVLEKTADKEAIIVKTDAPTSESEIRADEVGLKFRINVRASSKSPGRDVTNVTSSSEGEVKNGDPVRIKIVAENSNSDLQVSSNSTVSPAVANIRNVEQDNDKSSSKSLTSRALEEFHRKRNEAAKALASGSSPYKSYPWDYDEDFDHPERRVKVTEDLVSWECVEEENNSEKVSMTTDDENSKPIELKTSDDSKYSSKSSSENTYKEQTVLTKNKENPDQHEKLSSVNKNNSSSNVSDHPISPSKTASSGSDVLIAIQALQRNPQHVTSRNADVLMSQLETTDNQLLISLLDLISKSSAFTYNQNLFREHGCVGKLTKIVKYHSMALLKLGFKSSQSVIAAAAGAINNLSLNEENHKQFKDCIPSLVDLSVNDKLDDTTQVACMQALTNLSVIPTHHGQYTRLIQKLYTLMDQENNSIKLQSLKILANLSTNPEMVPHLLAAKAPSSVLDLLDQHADEMLVLRWTTLLANILDTVKEKNITPASLPTDEKAPSPETMYIALFGMDKAGPLKTKVFLLSKHKNEDIRYHATRMHNAMK